ncbi:hypothetical protein ACLBXM_14600 [Xanthobacteraceae bacterium A53D]
MSQTSISTQKLPAPTEPAQVVHLPVPRRMELLPVTPAPDTLPAPPEHQAPRVKSIWQRYGLFLVLVVTPVLAAVLYFGLIASDIYISESKFLVRSSSGSAGASLSTMVASESMSRAADETYAVAEYMTSRDAAASLAKEANLRDIMAREEADMFGRYPTFFRKQNEEQFYITYQRLVSVATDSATGISTVTVRTYRPEDSYTLATALMRIAERFVNRLNERSNADALKFSQSLVKEAQARVAEVGAQLAVYRNTQQMLDPQQESTLSLSMLGQMTTEMANLEATLAQQLAMSPDSPNIGPLRQRITAYRAEMDKLQKSVVGGNDSIASKLQEYEILVIEREIAVRALAAATGSLETARQETQAQRIYLQEVTTPNTPDQPLQPKRLLSILAVAFLAMCVYWIVRSFVANTMEHQA